MPWPDGISCSYHAEMPDLSSSTPSRQSTRPYCACRAGQDPEVAISEDDREAEPQQLDVQLPEVQLTLASLARLPTPELLQQTPLCQALSRWRTAVSFLFIPSNTGQAA